MIPSSEDALALFERELLRLEGRIPVDVENGRLERQNRREELEKQSDFCHDENSTEEHGRIEAVLVAEVCERLHLLRAPDEPLPLYRVLLEEYAQTTAELS